MPVENKDTLTNIYRFFNARDIDSILAFMTEDVHWPNGWEGGYVEGHEGIRDYWTRQWAEINPNVEPVVFNEKEDGHIEVEVHQVVKDLEGNLIFDDMVKHVYSFSDHLIKNMEIEKL